MEQIKRQKTSVKGAKGVPTGDVARKGVFSRAAGILLHPTSLPSPHGCGDAGPGAYAFVDQLAAAGVRWWQMLPTHPVGRAPGYSPYSSPSAFALSPLLISPELLQAGGLLPSRPSAVPTLGGGRAGVKVDFTRTIAHRERLLRAAFENRTAELQVEVARFEAAHVDWVREWALFAALRSVNRDRVWTAWPRDLARRNPKALATFNDEYSEEIEYHTFVQYLAFEQWGMLRRYANERGVGLVGDVPIFVSHDSADVWAHPKLFRLDRDGRPTHVSGCPPDDFAPLGQLWGHPQYAWGEHERTGFAWWVHRFSHMLGMFDAVRIDHFLGFYRAWVIQDGAKDARGGKYVLTPGRALFDTVEAALGNGTPGGGLPIIAEDLGAPVEGATVLRDHLGFPGMRVMQFGFGVGKEHLPFSYVRGCVAYTGTHDNETSAGMYARIKAQSPGELATATALGIGARQPAWDMITAVASSVADTAIFPVQDLLELDNRHRMNIPGEATGNWQWRMPGMLPEDRLTRLRKLLEATGRTGERPAGPAAAVKAPVEPLKRKKPQ